MIKIFLKKTLTFIRKSIEFIIVYSKPILQRKFSYYKVRKAYDYFAEEEIKSSYEHFKKFFYNAVFLDYRPLQEHALRKSLENHEKDFFYLEFGVHQGWSLNFLSSILKKKNINIYGFDSFEGLKEDWFGNLNSQKGILNLEGKIPKLNSNCIPIKGWVQDTVPNFIKEHQKLKINFLHMDLDTYQSTKDVLILLKPFLSKNAVILFDELYNFSGWRVGEYKALTEVFEDKDYKFISFGLYSKQSAIQMI